MIELIKARLDRYRPSNALEEQHAVKEIVQEVALYALWRADFFKVAAFQGGTSLRILRGLQRFSEDLDFILKTPNLDFGWNTYATELSDCFEEFGLILEVVPKERADKAIRQAELKDSSILNQLNLEFYSGPKDKKIKIKLEIDTNPPLGSHFDYTYLDFPLDYEVCHQDLSSNFTLKIHALLCRKYVKGRDWYDFNWYVKQGVMPNLPLLQNALAQQGPWMGQALTVNAAWVESALKNKINAIDWHDAAKDVERFLNIAELPTLKLWSKNFFNQKVERLFGK